MSPVGCNSTSHVFSFGLKQNKTTESSGPPCPLPEKSGLSKIVIGVLCFTRKTLEAVSLWISLIMASNYPLLRYCSAVAHSLKTSMLDAVLANECAYTGNMDLKLYAPEENQSGEFKLHLLSVIMFLQCLRAYLPFRFPFCSYI